MLKDYNMNKDEQGAWYYIYKLLLSQGYKRYALLFRYFKLAFVPEDDFIAAMVPDEMIIQIHPLLEEHCISAAIRHEILHEYFNHLHRSLEYFLKKGIYNRSISW